MVAVARHHPPAKRPRLRLVSNNPRPRSKAKDTALARWQGPDSIFFHKSQIKIGTRLLNFGRLNHGQIWRVIEIYTWAPDGHGHLVQAPATEVTRLSDDIVIESTNPHQIRQTTFSTMSYSAIWRLA